MEFNYKEELFYDTKVGIEKVLYSEAWDFDESYVISKGKSFLVSDDSLFKTKKELLLNRREIQAQRIAHMIKTRDRLNDNIPNEEAYLLTMPLK